MNRGIGPGHAMREAVRADSACERCSAAIHWNHKRSARNPSTGALQVVCRRCLPRGK